MFIRHKLYATYRTNLTKVTINGHFLLSHKSRLRRNSSGMHFFQRPGRLNPWSLKCQPNSCNLGSCGDESVVVVGGISVTSVGHVAGEISRRFRDLLPRSRRMFWLAVVHSEEHMDYISVLSIGTRAG